MKSYKEIITEARAPWEKFGEKWYNIKREYGVVIHPHRNDDGWLVRIEITGRDTIDLHSLNSVSKNWNQDQDGYSIHINNRGNLRKLLKLVKSKPLPKIFDNG